MRKILAISILLTLAVSFGAFAASPRWKALGDDHRFIIDSSNYGPYPGRITMFGNSLFVIPVANYLDDDFVSGARFSKKENMTLAFHYNLDSPGTRNLRSALAEFAEEEDNEQLDALRIKTFPDVLLGIKMGNTALGIRVAVAMDSISDSATTLEEEFMENDVVVSERTYPMDETTSSAKALDFSLGATMYETPAGDLDLGVRVGIQDFSQDDPNADTEISSTGGMDMAFDARLNKPTHEGEKTLIPMISVNIGSLPSAEYDEIAAPDVTEVSYVKGDIGLGVRKEISNKGFALLGLKGGYGAITSNPFTTIVERENNKIISREKKEVEETTDTSMGVTILAGVEYPVKKWLTVRGGVNVKFVSLVDEVVVLDETKNLKMDEDDVIVELVREIKSKNVDYYYNMGLRTTFGSLLIDLVLARNILHRGPNFLTGATGNWASSVCVTYGF